MATRLNKRDERRLRATLGKGLKDARKRAGLTQAESAELVGIASEVFGRIERGVMFPSVPTLMALCTALRAEPNELLGIVPVTEARAASWSVTSLAALLPDTSHSRRLLRNLARVKPSTIRLVAQLLNDLAP